MAGADTHWRFGETLKRSLSYLIDEYIISTEVRELVNTMHDEEHITYKQRQDIQETNITTEKMEKLLGILIEKSDEASYQCLIQKLQDSNHGDIVDALTSQMEMVKTLTKPPEEDIAEMAQRIRRDVTKVSIEELLRLATVMEEKIAGCGAVDDLQDGRPQGKEKHISKAKRRGTKSIKSQNRKVRQPSTESDNNEKMDEDFVPTVNQLKDTRKSSILDTVKNWFPKKYGDKNNYTELQRAQAGDKLYNVNVNCRHLDMAYAFNIVEVLENHGYNVYFNQRDDMPGTFIRENFEQSIKSCELVIVIMTRNFVTSSWCQWYFEVMYKLVMEKVVEVVAIIADSDVILRDYHLYRRLSAYIRTQQHIAHNDRSFWKKIFTKLPQSENLIKPVFQDLQIPQITFDGQRS